MKTIKISEKIVTRLSIYLRCLEALEHEGKASVSSKQLADRSGGDSLPQAGLGGVTLVGLGNLGSALMTCKGFQEKGFKISAVFDRDPAKIGRRVEGIQVMDTGSIVSVIRKRKIKIGILAVPAAPVPGPSSTRWWRAGSSPS